MHRLLLSLTLAGLVIQPAYAGALDFSASDLEGFTHFRLMYSKYSFLPSYKKTIQLCKQSFLDHYNRYLSERQLTLRQLTPTDVRADISRDPTLGFNYCTATVSVVNEQAKGPPIEQLAQLDKPPQQQASSLADVDIATELRLLREDMAIRSMFDNLNQSLNRLNQPRTPTSYSCYSSGGVTNCNGY